MKQFKHLGSYGLILDNDNIVLIKKHGGPYNGKLDLPGGTIEFGETPEEFVFKNADANGDGAVNALDIVVIINLIFSKKS